MATVTGISADTAFSNYSANRRIAQQVLTGSAANLILARAKINTLRDALNISSVKITGTNSLTGSTQAADAAWLMGLPGAILDTAATLVVTDTLANFKSFSSIATKATSLVLTGAASSNVVNLASDTTSLAIIKLATFKLGTGAGLTIQGTGAQIVAGDATALAKATVFNVTSANIAQAKTIFAYKNFSAASSILHIVDTADVIATTANAALLAAATDVKLTANSTNTLTVAQAKILAGLGSKFLSSGGGSFSLSASATDLLAVYAASNVFFAKKNGGSITVSASGNGVANTVSRADYEKLQPSIAALSGGATLVVTGDKTALQALNTFTAAGNAARYSGFSLTGSNTLAVADAVTLTTGLGGASLLSVATGASLLITGSWSALNAASATIAKATSLAVTSALVSDLSAAVPVVSAKKGSTLAVVDTYAAIRGALTTGTASAKAGFVTAYKSVTSFEVTNVALSEIATMVATAGFTYGPTTKFSVVDSAANLLTAINAANPSLAKATSVTLSVDASVSADDARKLVTLAGGNFSAAGHLTITGTATQILDPANQAAVLKASHLDVTSATAAQVVQLQGLVGYTGATFANLVVEDSIVGTGSSSLTGVLTTDPTALKLATKFKISGNATDLAAFKTAYTAATFTVAPANNEIELIGDATDLGIAAAGDVSAALSIATKVTVTGNLTVDQAKKAFANGTASKISDGSLTIRDTATNLAGWLSSDFTLVKANTVTVSGGPITAANLSAIAGNFPVKLQGVAVSDTPVAFAAAGVTAGDLTYASSVTLTVATAGTDDLVDVTTALALLPFSPPSLVLNDTAANILAVGAATALTAATDVKLASGGATIDVAGALRLAAKTAAHIDTNSVVVSITDTAANFLAAKSNSVLGAWGVANTPAIAVHLTGTNEVTASQAKDLDALFGLATPFGAANSHLVLVDSAAHILDTTNFYTSAVAAEVSAVKLSGANEVTIAQAATLDGINGISLAEGGTLVVTAADIAAVNSAVNTGNADLGTADGHGIISEVELQCDNSALNGNIEAADYVTYNGVYTKIGMSTDVAPALTIGISSGAGAGLSGLTDAQIINVTTVDAHAKGANVTIDLDAQAEGFTIIGTTSGTYTNTINGGKGADVITGGAGADTINGFTAGDTVDGLAGSDTINVLLGATAGLNAAKDSDIQNVEILDFSSATTSVVINLQNQTEGFTIIGEDTHSNVIVAGGSAANASLGTSATTNNITGSSAADKITGGAGIDIINNYTAGDTIDGGAGSADKLVLQASGAAILSNVADTLIGGVEIIDASANGGAVVLDLSGQTEGFNIKGVTSGYTNKIKGGKGANTISGASDQADSLTGGVGADTFTGWSAGDTIDGGAGNDTLVLTASGAYALTTTLLKNVEIIDAQNEAGGNITIDLTGQTGGFIIKGANDSTNHRTNNITGGGGADNITGGESNDIINGYTTGDTIDGGAGSTDQIVLTTAAQATALGAAGNALITNVEKVDVTGIAGATLNLSTQTEGFTIVAGTGADVITGGKGADDITGGITGANTFVYTTLTNSLAATYDTIQDFKTTDSFKIGRTISSANLKSVASTTNTGVMATDIAAALATASNFIANGATVVTLNNGNDPGNNGRYLVINDATAAFSATGDAVIKLAGAAAVASSNFIV